MSFFRHRLKSCGLCVLLAGMLCMASCTEPAAPEQSSAPAPPSSQTEASGGDTMQKSNIVYCAVGKVDEAAKTARVLFADGEIATIKWDGDAPTVGTVNIFEKAGETYQVQGSPTYPPPGDSFKEWQVYASGRQKRFWLNDMYFTDADTAFFVRYSDTEWRVFQGRSAMKTDQEVTKVYLYYTTELDDLAKVVRYAMVVGEYADEGKWPAATAASTVFLDERGNGWDSGDKDLS